MDNRFCFRHQYPISQAQSHAYIQSTTKVQAKLFFLHMSYGRVSNADIDSMKGRLHDSISHFLTKRFALK